ENLTIFSMGRCGLVVGNGCCGDNHIITLAVNCRGLKVHISLRKTECCSKEDKTSDYQTEFQDKTQLTETRGKLTITDKGNEDTHNHLCKCSHVQQSINNKGRDKDTQNIGS